MLQRVLVATDFSPAARRAVARAALICKQSGAALTVAHAVPERALFDRVFHRHDVDYGAIVTGAQVALQAVLEEITRTYGLSANSALCNGPAHREIAAAARNAQADLLVIGARGEGEAAAGPLGGTALKVFLDASSLLLLVRREASGPYGKVLAAVDDLAAGRFVLGAALELSDRATICELLHVFDVPFAERLRAHSVKEATLDAYAASERARCERELATLASELQASSRVRTIAVRGSAATVLQEIRNREPDLVVLGKRAVYPRPADHAQSVGLTVAFHDSADLLGVP